MNDWIIHLGHKSHIGIWAPSNSRRVIFSPPKKLHHAALSECWNWDTNIPKLQYRRTSSQFSCLIKCRDSKSRESCCMNQECFPPKILWFLKLEELQALQSECHDKSLRKLNMQCLEFISYMDIFCQLP